MSEPIIIAAGSVLVVAAYLLGAIPFAIVVGKWFWHVDVREHGSGNVGTTNVFRVLGKKAGTLVLIGDMSKGFLPTFAAALFLPPLVHPHRRDGALCLGTCTPSFCAAAAARGWRPAPASCWRSCSRVFLVTLAVFLLVLRHHAASSAWRSICAALAFVDPRPGSRPAALVQDPGGAGLERRHLRPSRQHPAHRPSLRDPDHLPLEPGPRRLDRHRRARDHRWAPREGHSDRLGQLGQRLRAPAVWHRHQAQVLTMAREEARELEGTHVNQRFLPGVELPDEMRFVAMDDADLRRAT